MTDEGRRGVGSAATALAGQAINFAVLTAAAIVLPRLLGPDDYGRFAAAMAVVAMLLVVSSLGMPFLELRFLPPLRRAGRHRELADLTSTLWGFRLAAGALAAGVCAFWVHRSKLEPGSEIAVVVGAFAFSRYAFAGMRGLLLPLGRVRGFAGMEVTMSLSFLLSFAGGYGIRGLEGGFRAAALTTLVLLIWAAILVRTEVRLSPLRIRPHLLGPLVGHGLNAFVGSVATAVRVGLPVWLVATWCGPREGGYFGLAMQAFAVVMGLFIAARESLTPILSELEETGEEERVFLWTGWMLRLGVAVISAGALIWALLGREISAWILGEEYAPVYAPVAWILVAAAATAAGSMANGLLFLRKRSGVAAWNLSLGTLMTLAAVGLALGSTGDGEVSRAPATAAAAAVAAGAAGFMLLAHLRVWRLESLRLPLFRTAALMLPLALVWPASSWGEGVAVRGATALGFVAVYVIAAVATGLLDLKSLAYVRRLAFAASAHEEVSPLASAGGSDSDSAM